MRKRPLTATMEMRRAIKARNWQWAEEVAVERMRGSLARRWLKKIWRLQDEERAG